MPRTAASTQQRAPAPAAWYSLTAPPRLWACSSRLPLMPAPPFLSPCCALPHACGSSSPARGTAAAAQSASAREVAAVQSASAPASAQEQSCARA
eukprot:3331827-Rhodomonas_salina.2